MTNEVLVENHGGRLDITINRAERRNAITGPVAQAIREAALAANEDPEVRVVVLRGAGGTFSSGLDLKEFNADPAPPWVREFQGSWRGCHEAIFALDKPVVCALEGYAINAGAALALSADFLVVGEGAFLQVGEVRQGRPAPMNLAWLRMRFSDAVARQVMLLGRRIGAAELHRLGIAFEVVPDGQVASTVEALASELAELPAGGLAGAKQVLRKLDLPGEPNQWFELAARAAAATGTRSGAIRSLKG